MHDEGRRPLVWIVDHRPIERQLTQRSLGDKYTSETFADGSEVVARLADDTVQPDVLLLAWVMPGMSGDEVCRWLRSQERTRELPVILVASSRVEIQGVVAGLSLGANDYVARPFVPEELRARVDVALRAKALNDANQRERARLETINQLGQTLFAVGGSVFGILDATASSFVSSLCDGCAIILLPGELPSITAVQHRHDLSGQALAAISSLADPTVHAFASSEQALASLPPAYHPYIRRFGLGALAILPFPTRTEIQGVVTVTRDRGGRPFDPDDTTLLATCLEYASLAVQTALQLEAERVAHSQLTAILEHAPIGIVVADVRGVVALANPEATALLPHLAASTDLRHVLAAASQILIDDIAVDPGAWLAQLVDATRLERATLEITTADSLRRLSLASVPLFDTRDVRTGCVITLDDVTAEHALTDARARMSQFQEQMLGIVGHDLRNPLGAILAASELVSAYSVGHPKIQPVLARLNNSVKRMTNIIGQLYDVTSARLGQGMPLTLAETDLTPIALQVIDELALAHTKSTFKLLAPHAVSGVWDAERLAQIVSNLATNAVHYGCPEAPIIVEIEAHDGRVILRVKNEVRDAPIPPSLLQGVFAPYERGPDARLHRAGLGLGLYIVHEIVRAHHGTISVRSTVEDGTVFEVVLPTSSRTS